MIRGKLFYHKEMPTVLILEAPDGTRYIRRSVTIEPIRESELTLAMPPPCDEDLIPVQDALYRHYGVEPLNPAAKKAVIRFRCSFDQQQAIQEAASEEGISISHWLCNLLQDKLGLNWPSSGR